MKKQLLEASLCLALLARFAEAQEDTKPPPVPPRGEGGPKADPPPPGGPGAPGAPRQGNFGGMGQEKQKLVERFDKDGDRRLDAAERKAAREYLKKERAEGRGGPGGFRGPSPGEALAPQIASQADKDGDHKV